jgi:hypothetical protein
LFIIELSLITMTKILVNLHKLKNLNCGLGQVALNMGKYLSQLPNANDYTFIVPKGFTGYFGNKVKYTELNGLNTFIHFYKLFSIIFILKLLNMFKPLNY